MQLVTSLEADFVVGWVSCPSIHQTVINICQYICCIKVLLFKCMYSLAELGIVNYIIGIWFSNQKMTSMAYKIYHFMGHRKHVKSYIYIETFLFSQKVFKLTQKKKTF